MNMLNHGAKSRQIPTPCWTRLHDIHDTLSFRSLFPCLCACTLVLHRSTSAAGGTKTGRRGSRPSPSSAPTPPASVTTASSQWVLSCFYLQRWHHGSRERTCHHWCDCWALLFLFPRLRSVWACRRPRTWPNLWRHASYLNSQWLPPWGPCPPSPFIPPPAQATPSSRDSPSHRRSCTRLLGPWLQRTRRFCFLPTDQAQKRVEIRGGALRIETVVTSEWRAPMSCWYIRHRRKTSLAAAPVLHSSGTQSF